MIEKLISVMQEALEIEDQELSPSDNFKDLDEWDSLARLSLIAELDSEFEVQIETQEFESINTIQELMDVIVKKQSTI